MSSVQSLRSPTPSRCWRMESRGAALLDVQLLNGMITPVAERLLALEIPFVLVSAYTGPELDKPVLVKAPRVDKPVSQPWLLGALTKAGRASNGLGMAPDQL